MPLATINKIISLFIVGTIFLILPLIIFWESISKFVLEVEGANTISGTVAGGAIFLALSALAGVAIEGLTDLTIRKIVKWSFEKPFWACIVGQNSIHSSMRYWEKAFRRKARSNLFYKRTIQAYGHGSRDLAAGFLFRNAPKEHVDWVVSHYATFYLATNFLFILLLFGVLGTSKFVFLVVDFDTAAVVTALVVRLGALGFALSVTSSAAIFSVVVLVACLVAALYATWSLAVDRYLYTFETAFRFAALSLDKDQSPNSLLKAANEGEGPVPRGSCDGQRSCRPDRRRRRTCFRIEELQGQLDELRKQCSANASIGTPKRLASPPVAAPLRLNVRRHIKPTSK